jgi:hypothetical protein
MLGDAALLFTYPSMAKAGVTIFASTDATSLCILEDSNRHLGYLQAKMNRQKQ